MFKKRILFSQETRTLKNDDHVARLEFWQTRLWGERSTMIKSIPRRIINNFERSVVFERNSILHCSWAPRYSYLQNLSLLTSHHKSRDDAVFPVLLFFFNWRTIFSIFVFQNWMFFFSWWSFNQVISSSQWRIRVSTSPSIIRSYSPRSVLSIFFAEWYWHHSSTMNIPHVFVDINLDFVVLEILLVGVLIERQLRIRSDTSSNSDHTRLSCWIDHHLRLEYVRWYAIKHVTT